MLPVDRKVKTEILVKMEIPVQMEFRFEPSIFCSGGKTLTWSLFKTKCAACGANTREAVTVPPDSGLRSGTKVCKPCSERLRTEAAQREAEAKQKQIAAEKEAEAERERNRRAELELEAEQRRRQIAVELETARNNASKSVVRTDLSEAEKEELEAARKRVAGWPSGTISHVLVWEEPFCTALGPTRIVASGEHFLSSWLFEKKFGVRFSKVDTTHFALCGIGLDPQFPTYPFLMRARHEWGSVVVDAEDQYIKEEVDLPVGGGQKVIALIFWDNDGTLVRGKPHIRPQNWGKPEDPLARRWYFESLPHLGKTLSNTYTVTLNNGEVLHIEAYHLLFRGGGWEFDWREQELKVTREGKPQAYEGLGSFGSARIDARDVASIVINDKEA